MIHVYVQASLKMAVDVALRTCFFVLGLMATQSVVVEAQLEIPCVEFHPRLTIPCLCGLNEINATRINCDGVAFAEFPVLPYRFYIQEFSHQNAGTPNAWCPTVHRQ